jgi:hypothetical protein
MMKATCPHPQVQTGASSHRAIIQHRSLALLSLFSIKTSSNLLICYKNNMILSIKNWRKTWIRVFSFRNIPKKSVTKMMINISYIMDHQTHSCSLLSSTLSMRESSRPSNLLNQKLNKILKMTFRKGNGLLNSRVSNKRLSMNAFNI